MNKTMDKEEKIKTEEVQFKKFNIDLSTIYEPANGSVVLEVIMRDKTKSGIIIPEQSREKDKVQIVVAVGSECKRIKKGNWVLVGPNSRPMVLGLVYGESDPIQYIQVYEHDIMGVVDPLYKEILNECRSDKLPS